MCNIRYFEFYFWCNNFNILGRGFILLWFITHGTAHYCVYVFCSEEFSIICDQFMKLYSCLLKWMIWWIFGQLVLATVYNCSIILIVIIEQKLIFLPLMKEFFVLFCGVNGAFLYYGDNFLLGKTTRKVCLIVIPYYYFRKKYNNILFIIHWDLYISRQSCHLNFLHRDISWELYWNCFLG